jgi:hypothetical protein
MILVCSSHVKDGIELLSTPHVVKIKEENFKGGCVYCYSIAKYKLFYSVPLSKAYILEVKSRLKEKN